MMANPRRDSRGSSRALGGWQTPAARAWLITLLVVGLALLMIGWSLSLPWALTLVVAFCIAVGCAIVFTRIPLQHVGVLLIALFCFTASWDQTGVAGLNIRSLFLFLGGLLLAAGLDLRRLPPVPWWLHAYGLSAVIVSCLQGMMPVNGAYLEGRYASSASGLSLGSRPGELPSLLSLLFNNYAVPIVIVVACMYLPKAMRWLIGAYVVGAAFSCFAAALSYYGQPALAQLFGGIPIPAGMRAAGFTSHPLRLATSGVMAMALACWMGLQGHRGLRWAGWVSVPLLLMGLYVSGSRGGMVAGLLVLILCTFLLPAVRRRVHLVISGVGAALAAVYFLFPTAVFGVIGKTRLLGDRTAMISDTGRAQILTQGLDDFKTSPIFGIGIRFLAEAHTLYVGVLAAGGLIFATGYLLFNVGSIRTSLEAVKVDRSLGGALLATLVASLWYWTVADMIQTKTVAIIYGFIIALWWQGRMENGGASPRQGASVEGAYAQGRAVETSGLIPR